MCYNKCMSDDNFIIPPPPPLEENESDVCDYAKSLDKIRDYCVKFRDKSTAKTVVPKKRRKAV